MDAMIGFRNVPAFCQVQLAELRQQLKQMAPVPVPPGSTSPSPPSPTSPGGLTSPQRVRHAPTPTTTPVSVNWTQKWWREWVEMRLERIFYTWKKLSPQQKDCKGSGLPSKVSTKQEIERKVLALVVLPWNCWGAAQMHRCESNVNSTSCKFWCRSRWKEGIGQRSGDLWHFLIGGWACRWWVYIYIFQI